MDTTGVSVDEAVGICVARALVALDARSTGVVTKTRLGRSCAIRRPAQPDIEDFELLTGWLAIRLVAGPVEEAICNDRLHGCALIVLIVTFRLPEVEEAHACVRFGSDADKKTTGRFVGQGGAEALVDVTRERKLLGKRVRHGYLLSEGGGPDAAPCIILMWRESSSRLSMMKSQRSQGYFWSSGNAG
jgi:hypothetical protein